MLNLSPKDMYQLGIRSRHPRTKLLAGVMLAVLLLIGLIAWTQYLLRPNTIIEQSPITTNQVYIPAVSSRTYDEGSFTLQLPADWQFIKKQTTPFLIYSWQAMKPIDSRYLDIYVDNQPTNFALNRLLAITATGDHIQVGGTVSDNCTSFTKPPAAGQSSVLAKWSGLDFNCDVANYARDVVGTSSPDGMYKTVLTGQSGAQHSFFFVYTDNSSAPDYSLFYNVLNSVQVK